MESETENIFYSSLASLAPVVELVLLFPKK